MPDFVEKKLLAQKLRWDSVKLISRAKAAHIGSCLSCADMVASIYCDFRLGLSDGIDHFVLSKGHAAPVLYSALNWLGKLSNEELDQFCLSGSLLEEHPSPMVASINYASGSLGHGLSLGCGVALDKKIKGLSGKTFVLMSDGECNEGSVWEAALFASAQGLGNFVGLIDYNKWQATGRSDEVLALGPLVDKWVAFGWSVSEIDGHDFDQLARAINGVSPDRPTMIVCHTVKGKGVDFMEDDNNWHYRVPDAKELSSAKRQLGID